MCPAQERDSVLGFAHTAWERQGGKEGVSSARHRLGMPRAIGEGCFPTRPTHSAQPSVLLAFAGNRNELLPDLGKKYTLKANIDLIHPDLDILQDLLATWISNKPAGTRLKYFDGVHKQRPTLQGSKGGFL